MRAISIVATVLILLAVAGAAVLQRAGAGAFGELVRAGEPIAEALPPADVADRDSRPAAAAAALPASLP